MKKVQYSKWIIFHTTERERKVKCGRFTCVYQVYTTEYGLTKCLRWIDPCVYVGTVNAVSSTCADVNVFVCCVWNLICNQCGCLGALVM